MKWYQYIFYRIFLFYRKNHDEDESSISAMLFISIIMFLNIITIGGMLHGFKILPVFFNLPVQGVLFMVGLFVLNYFLFLYKKKYLVFVQAYNQNTSSNKKIQGWLVVSYIVISFALLILMAFFKL